MRSASQNSPSTNSVRDSQQISRGQPSSTWALLLWANDLISSADASSNSFAYTTPSCWHTYAPSLSSQNRHHKKFRSCRISVVVSVSNTRANCDQVSGNLLSYLPRCFSFFTRV